MKASATVMIPLACLCAVAGVEADVVTKTTELSGVTQVRLNGHATLNIRQGDKEFVTVSADDALIDDIEVRIDGNTLVIGKQQESKRFFQWDDAEEISLEVQVKQLSSLENNGASAVTIAPFNVDGDLYVSNRGAGKIKVDALKANDVDIECHGAGDITLAKLKARDISVATHGAGHTVFDDVDADSLAIAINGAGEVEVTGSGAVDELNVVINGVGEMEAAGTVAQRAKVEIHGAGSVILNAQKYLDAGIYGAGSVRYNGDPQIAQNIRGAGVVKSYNR